MSIKELLVRMLSRFGSETFTATRSVGNSGTLNGVYDKATGTVRIQFFIFHNANISSGTTLYTIPEKYRPKTAVRGTAFIFTPTTGASQGFAYDFGIATSGEVTQNGTSSMRSIMGMAEYKI